MSITRFNLKFICMAFALVSIALTANLQASSAQTAESFVQSMVVYNEVVTTQIKDGPQQEALKLSQQALHHARSTNKTDLNEHLDGLGDKYYSLFIMGLELQIAGRAENDDQQISEGRKALDSWYNWYASNLESIRRIN